jgi:hypothetical protein
MATEQVETAVYRLRIEGQEQVDRATRSVEGLATAEDKLASANRTTSAQIQRGIAAYDPVIRQQEKYLAAMKQIENARERGTASESQLIARLELEKKALNDATIAAEHLRRAQANAQITPFKSAEQSALTFEAAINKVEKATVSHTNAQKLQRYEMINMGRQLQDIGVSLFSGQSPLMVGVQQIPQFIDAATSGGVSLGSALKQMGTAIGGFVLGIGGAVTGVAALAAGVAYLAIQWDKVQKSSQLALIGAGARTGTTVGDINRFVEQTRAPSGLSPTESRALGEDLTRTGDIVISKLHGMGDAVVGFAQLTDKSMDEASKAMVQFATDPQKALDALAKTYGEFSIETRKAVDAAIEAGDKTKAWQIIIDATAESNRKAADSMNWLQKAWRNLAIPEFTKPRGPEEQLKAAQARVSALQAAPGGAGFGRFGASDLQEAINKVKELQAEIAKVNADKITAEFTKTAVEIDKATKAQIRMMPVAEAVGGAAKLAAQYAVDYANAVDQGAKAEVAAAAAAANRALAQAQINAQAKETLWSLQNQAAAAQAVTAAEQIAAQATATRNQLLHDNVDATIAEKVAAEQLANAHAQATANVQRQVEALEDSTKMIKAQQNGTEDTTAAAIAYKNAIAAGASETAAAALSAATLANYSAKAAVAAQQFAQQMRAASMAAEDAAAATALAQQRAAGNNPFAVTNLSPGGTSLSGGVAGVQPLVQTPSGYYAANTAEQFAIAYAQQQGTMDQFFNVKPGSLNPFTGATQPDALKNSIDDLTASTDSLNATNQDLLSPYYTQDPRTSHIGFRSQGMALGGYVDVPGGTSSNDNMIATIPVASGERIYIDPMTNRRGSGGGSGMVINISSPITINGNANADQFARTVYQSNQQLAKQVRNASQ